MESSSLRCEVKEIYQNMGMCPPEKNPTVNECKNYSQRMLGQQSGHMKIIWCYIYLFYICELICFTLIFDVPISVDI